MPEKTLDSPTSKSHAPDLDWSQVRETVRMLHLSVAQIEIAMRDGDDSVNTLTNSFTSMVQNIATIAETAKLISDENSPEKSLILDHCNAVNSQIQSSIIAFQFYDKLSQRLSHAAESLASLSGLVGDRHRLFNPQEWSDLQNLIRSKYSMQEEVEMFDALFNGANIEEALSICQLKRDKDEDKIELF